MPAEKQDVLDHKEIEHWRQASIEEKLQMATNLRECFHGKEAASGRLQGICQLLNAKNTGKL